MDEHTTADPAEHGVGLVIGTEDATPLEFWVGVPADQFLQLDDVVATSRPVPGRDPVDIYGVVTQVRARHEGSASTPTSSSSPTACSGPRRPTPRPWSSTSRARTCCSSTIPTASSRPRTWTATTCCTSRRTASRRWGCSPRRAAGTPTAPPRPSGWSIEPCCASPARAGRWWSSPATTTTAGAGLVVVDGPIRRREGVPNAVGHIKTHHHRYLPPALAPIIGELDAGERTPMFAIGAPFPRLS